MIKYFVAGLLQRYLAKGNNVTADESASPGKGRSDGPEPRALISISNFNVAPLDPTDLPQDMEHFPIHQSTSNPLHFRIFLFSPYFPQKQGTFGSPKPDLGLSLLSVASRLVLPTPPPPYILDIPIQNSHRDVNNGAAQA